jgi:hypothetical protein
MAGCSRSTCVKACGCSNCQIEQCCLRLPSCGLADGRRGGKECGELFGNGHIQNAPP